MIPGTRTDIGILGKIGDRRRCGFAHSFKIGSCPRNSRNPCDSAGRITSESDDVSSVIYVYNDAGQITSTTQSSLDGPTVTLDYTYDDAGHRTQMSAFVDGSCDFVDDYSYDSLGRVVSVHRSPLLPGEGQGEGCNAVADVLITLAYNAANQTVSIDRYQDGQLAVEGDYSYDSLGRLVGLVYHQGMTVLNSYSWTYSGDSWSPLPPGEGQGEGWSPTGGLMPVHDTNGVTDALMSGGFAGVSLLTSCTSNDGTANYSYDPTGQLIAVTGGQANESYSYDANGNRTNAGYVTGADNRLLSDGVYRYEYDGEGNRIAKFIDVNADGVLDAGDTDITQYTWDARERLVEVIDRATYGGDPTQIVDYQYDVENRWVGEAIDSNGDGVVDHQIRFAYDGNQIVLQFEKDGPGAVTGQNVTRRYLWQPDAVDQLMADERTHLDAGNIVSDEVLWALTDRQGSVNDLAKRDATTGVTSVVDHIIRDSFGKVITESDPSQGTLIGASGRPVDLITGLENHLNRWTDPKTANWLSQDPDMFYGRDMNLYRCCGNSPTNATDPSGLDIIITDPGSLRGEFTLPDTTTKHIGVTSESFLSALKAASNKDIMVYLGHHPYGSAPDTLKFYQNVYFSSLRDWEYLHKDKIVGAIKKTKPALMILGACATDTMAKYIASEAKICVVGTNRYTYAPEVNRLLKLFFADLAKGSSVYAACKNANDQYKADPLPSLDPQASLHPPELIPHGPDITIITKKK